VTAIARLFAVMFSQREPKHGHFFVSAYESGLRHDRRSSHRSPASMVAIKDNTSKHRCAAVGARGR
jgi:hypothetical protein